MTSAERVASIVEIMRMHWLAGLRPPAFHSIVRALCPPNTNAAEWREAADRLWTELPDAARALEAFAPESPR